MSTDMPMVYVVDDELEARESVGWVLRSRSILWEGFASAEAFESAIDNHPVQFGGSTAWPRSPCCLLLDVGMPGTSGLILFERLLERRLTERMPVIFLTGHGDVPMAVSTLKRGAFDFVEKPASAPVLLAKIDLAIAASKDVLRRSKDVASVRDRISCLTRREREVTYHAIQGLTNNEIADQLSINVRTVETHRAAAFTKLGVRSALDLMNQLRAAAEDPLSLVSGSDKTAEA